MFGRHGGATTFDLPIAHRAVYQVALKNRGLYFLFMNTQRFCPPLPNIIHLEGTVNPDEKQRFINTCDAYLHARSHGETFGLAIAEFAVCDKPILTCRGTDNEHLAILRNKALTYTFQVDLMRLLLTFRRGMVDMRDNG